MSGFSLREPRRHAFCSLRLGTGLYVPLTPSWKLLPYSRASDHQPPFNSGEHHKYRSFSDLWFWRWFFFFPLLVWEISFQKTCVLFCYSESCENIETSESAAKLNAPEGRLREWLGKWQMLMKDITNTIVIMQSWNCTCLRCNNYILLHWWILLHKDGWIWFCLL